VVVCEYEYVLEAADETEAKGANNVGMDETADVRRFVDWRRIVGVPCGVCLDAVWARGSVQAFHLRRYVGAERAESLEYIWRDVETVVQSSGKRLSV
jgi:hypothetical protein